MAEYYNVTTNQGDIEVANAITNGTKIQITHIAFGDGNGSVPTPNKSRTALVREVHRQAVTKYERHAANPNWIVIETIIPSDIGGFTIREMGIIGNGQLISHGSHAPYEKVADLTGVSEYRLKFTQNVTDGNVVSITLDDSLIYATQAWVDENYVARDEIINDLTTDDAFKPVSAKQAKKLQDEKLAISSLVDDLTTGGTDKAITAEAIKLFFNMFSQTSDVQGYKKIANSIDPTKPFIVQWGYVNSRTAFSLPIAFTTKKFATIGIHDGGQVDVNIISDGAYRSNLTAQNFLDNRTTEVAVSYISIGY